MPAAIRVNEITYELLTWTDSKRPLNERENIKQKSTVSLSCEDQNPLLIGSLYDQVLLIVNK